MKNPTLLEINTARVNAEIKIKLALEEFVEATGLCIPEVRFEPYSENRLLAHRVGVTLEVLL